MRGRVSVQVRSTPVMLVREAFSHVWRDHATTDIALASEATYYEERTLGRSAVRVWDKIENG